MIFFYFGNLGPGTPLNYNRFTTEFESVIQSTGRNSVVIRLLIKFFFSNHNRFTTESEPVNGFGFWEKSAVDSVVNLAPNLSRLLKCSSLLPTPVKQICLFEDS